MIYTLADITVKRFMLAMFNGEKEDIDNWEDLYTQYIDLSGMANYRQLNLLISIYNLETRLWTVDKFIEIQTHSFNSFGEPYEPAYSMVKKYGHRIVWPSTDLDVQLRRIHAKEQRQVAELEKLEKDLALIDESGVVKEDRNARHDFIRLLNRISEKVKIDREKDDMESVCIMIRDYIEECEHVNNKKAA